MLATTKRFSFSPRPKPTLPSFSVAKPTPERFLLTAPHLCNKLEKTCRVSVICSAAPLSTLAGPSAPTAILVQVRLRSLSLCLARSSAPADRRPRHEKPSQRFCPQPPQPLAVAWPAATYRGSVRSTHRGLQRHRTRGNHAFGSATDLAHTWAARLSTRVMAPKRRR